MLGEDAILMIANVTVLVEGVADLLQIAGTRDNAVNHPALSVVVRAAMETAGQVAWLLSDLIDGVERGRRYLVWRFNDLRHQRHVLSEFRSNENVAAAVRALDNEEQELFRLVSEAKWQARPTTIHSNGDVSAAALLDRTGTKVEPLPKVTELIRTVSSTESLYALLSISAHGHRFGVRHGLQKSALNRGGGAEVLVGGFGLPPNLCIGLACLAVDIPSRSIAGWNGIGASELHAQVQRLVKRAGIG